MYLRCLGADQMRVFASGLSIAGQPFYFLSPSLGVHRQIITEQLGSNRFFAAADCLVVFIKVCFEQVPTTHV